MKKIWHVVERIDARYGGPANSVPNLARSLNTKGFENIIVAGYKGIKNNKLISEYNLKNNLHLSISQKLGIVPFIYLSSHIKYGRPSFIFFHNLWNLITLFGYLYCHLFKVPYAVTPRGSLFEWSLEQGHLRKQIAWRLFQKRMLEHAEFIHVTSEAELAAVSRLATNKCILSKNGIDRSKSTSVNEKNRDSSVEQYQSSILYFGRIHPKKNIETLIKSYARSNLYFTHRLSIVGHTAVDTYTKTLLELARTEGCEKRIDFLPFQEGHQKLETFNSHCLLVLPSFTENFGIVVTEALAVGMPVIASKGTPWKELEDTGAGFWVDCTTSPEMLTESLNKFSSLEHGDYFKMSQKAVELSLKYSWTSCVAPLKKELERILV